MANELSGGLALVENLAKRFNLTLGSRHWDSHRGVIRLSLEATVDLEGRETLRTPTVELSREFLEDLSAQKEYQTALTNYLQSLSLRVRHPKPWQFLTIAGIPLDLEIHWPFRPVQNQDASFVHVLARVGSPWTVEANFAVILAGTDQLEMGIISLSPPTTESFIVNCIRVAIDRKFAQFYPVGRHPTSLQQVQLSTSFFDRDLSDDADVNNFLERKVYWLGFREGGADTLVSIADPYDCAYLGRPLQRLKQMARVLSASKIVAVDSTGQYAHATDELLAMAPKFETDLQAVIGRGAAAIEEGDSRAKRRPSVFISYSSDDAAFATSLAYSLAGRNVGVWLDQWEIRIGDSLTKKIGEALRRNDFIVVVLSPSSISSEWVQKELAEAMTREIKEKRVVVLPVIARRCEVPPFLTDKKYADFTIDSTGALDALADAIGRHQN